MDLQPVVVEHGRPNKTLDRIGKVVGFPQKILPFDFKINNHELSDETREKLLAYLEANDITDVYVAVNQYEPKDQWRRLKENHCIAPGWRYTVGTLSWLGYTILPNRVFGGDNYNAFTNTLYVNSDVATRLLCAAAYAKDIHSRKNPGNYAVLVNDLPLFSVWREGRAVSDVLSYTRICKDLGLEKETYRVMYPQMGGSIASGGTPLVSLDSPVGTALFIGPAPPSGRCLGRPCGRSHNGQAAGSGGRGSHSRRGCRRFVGAGPAAIAPD